MSRLTKLGVLLLLAGIVVLGFQSISTLMGANRTAEDLTWERLTLADVFGGLDSELFDSDSFYGAGEIIRILVDAPLFLWLFGLAFLCFVINAFAPR